MHELAEEMALSRVPGTKKGRLREQTPPPKKKTSEKIGHLKFFRLFFLGNLVVQKKLNLASKFVVYQSEAERSQDSGLCTS